jgi:hypothetical protein
MKRTRFWVILVVACAVLAVPIVIFCIRPPVLVVTNTTFAALYGKSRLRQQRFAASLALFQRVKPVLVADDAGPDMVSIAVVEAARQPLCVLFPRDQSMAALRFHEQFPETPVVLLSGLVPIPDMPNPDGFLCIYGVNRPVDMYRAGLFAEILGNMSPKPVKKVEKQGKPAVAPPVSPVSGPKTYVLWQDSHVHTLERELFSQGIREKNPESEIIFVNSIAEMPDMKAISCTVLTGAGSEYLGKNPRMPLILFSWIDPALTSREVIVLFDDSVWALAVPAVRMAVQKQAEGIIPSKPLIFAEKIDHNGVFRMLKKSAKKMP